MTDDQLLCTGNRARILVQQQSSRVSSEDLKSRQLLKSLLGSAEDIVHRVEVFATSLAYSMALGIHIHQGKQ